MRYEIPFVWHTASAKNKGRVPYYAQSDAQWFALEAADDMAAWAAVNRLVASKRDQRPITGQSYIRRWRAAEVHLNDGPAPVGKLPRFKAGDRIVLHKPHGCAHTEDGRGYRLGVIDEVLGETHYGIALDGYPHIADFHLREFSSHGV